MGWKLCEILRNGVGDRIAEFIDFGRHPSKQHAVGLCSAPQRLFKWLLPCAVYSSQILCERTEVAYPPADIQCSYQRAVTFEPVPALGIAASPCKRKVGQDVPRMPCPEEFLSEPRKLVPAVHPGQPTRSQQVCPGISMACDRIEDIRMCGKIICFARRPCGHQLDLAPVAERDPRAPRDLHGRSRIAMPFGQTRIFAPHGSGAAGSRHSIGEAGKRITFERGFPSDLRARVERIDVERLRADDLPQARD